jgi:hypothetical protein
MLDNSAAVRVFRPLTNGVVFPAACLSNSFCRSLSGKLGDLFKTAGLYLALTSAGALQAETFLGSGEAVITDRGPHHAVWARLSQYVNSYGDVVIRSNGYVALATGMHYLKDGVWTESREEIEILPSGYAVARQGQHRVIWAGNANTAGAVHLYSSLDDKEFKSHVLGLAYTDKVTGQGTMFAVLKADANGVVLGNNQVLYPDCFDPADGVVASLRYTYTIAGFEQDLIIHNQLPPPEQFGLSSATARLELFSEFIAAPDATKDTIVLQRETSPLRAQMAEPDLTDDILDFGALRIGTGNAFPMDDPDTTLQTGKSWEIRDGRRVMVEKIDYVTILPFLLQLPPMEAKAQNLQKTQTKGTKEHARLPARPRNATERDRMKMQMANASLSLQGFVIDYVILGSTNNFTFKGDATYYASGQVILTGTTVIEGGTVIKSTNGNDVKRLWIQGPLDCRTASWLPATFTGKDDDTIGETITSLSTGNPTTNYYGYYVDLTGNANVIDLHDVRMRYARRGVNMGTGCDLTLQHAQIGSSFAGIVNSGGNIRLRNVLINSIQDTALAAAGGTNRAEHVTFHRINKLRSSDSGTTALTNCLLIAVTNNLYLTGGPNATNSSDTGVFTTVGAGARYLAAGSSYRNAGTTNISTNLLAELRQRTTYPPELLNGTTIMYVSNLTQRAARDNDSSPDLGYHYDPIDWCVGNVFVTNCHLNIDPGVVVAAFTNKGIILEKYGNLVSSGTATQMAILTRYNMVQEEANTNWMATTPYFSTVSVESGHTNTGFSASFTKCTLPAGSGRHFYTGATNDVARLSHCQLFGGEILFEQGSLLSLFNNLLVRSGTRVQYAGSDFLGYWQNNTFLGGTAHWDATNQSNIVIWVDHNLFDNTAIVQFNALSNSFNGYVTNAARLTNHAASDYIFPTNAVAYERGALGDFYLPTNVMDRGGWLAGGSSLYHFTTQTNNVKDGATTLDLGFHYLALTNGLPCDSDGDGEPDYLEDTFGDNVQAGDERNWLVFDTDSDYDGRTDWAETNLDNTLPNNPLSVTNTLLGRWRFNTNTWIGEQGQLPTVTNSLQPLATWHGNGVAIGHYPGGLRYREVETNGSYNFNLRSGTIRFWYRPNWSSTNAPGAPANAPFFQVGRYTETASYGMWSFGFADTNGSLIFSAQSNGVHVIYIRGADAPYTFVSNRWYQLALTYSPSNVALYINGEFLATTHFTGARPFRHLKEMYLNSHGISYLPAANFRRTGFVLGEGVNGAMEDLEIYNYPLTAQEIARDFPNFHGASGVTIDTDYDGRSDLLETYVDGTVTNDATSAAACRLGYFRFNNVTNGAFMTGEQGQLPIVTNVSTALEPVWSGNALYLSSGWDRSLKYRDVETNGWANFNCQKGAVRLWFKPIVTTLGRLVHVGGSSGSWTFTRNSVGDYIRLDTASNGVSQTVLNAPIHLTNGFWYHLALNYTSTNSELYVNGELLTNSATGVTLWPPADDRTNGLVIGNGPGDLPMAGYMDELETFNYTLTLDQIKRQYDAVKSTDYDLNGIPDLLEDSLLPATRPFTGVPFAITGTIEAEQFDLGGKGIAYSNAVANVWTNDYRPSGLEITNCTDKGGGYCVDKLVAGDWLKYTLDVRVSQNYAIEARIAGIGNTGGVFSIEFSTNSVVYTNTGPLTVLSTNWHEVTRRMIWLNKGTNVMKLSFLTNAIGADYVGKLNYISIYPGFNAGATNLIATNVVTGLQTNENWLTASNNAWLIQNALDTLPASTNGGGVIVIPAGRWFIAQKQPYEGFAFEANSAVYVARSNTEIRGEGPGKTNTTLIAWFRSTTALVVGVDINWSHFAVTNFTVRELSFEGRPHNRSTNSAGGGFEPIWESGGIQPAHGEIGSLVTVMSHIVISQPKFTNLTQNLVFTNCLFRNPARYSIVGGWSNCLVTACDFVFRDTTFDSTNGIWPYPHQTIYPTITTGNGPSGQVGVFTGGMATYNTVVISNTFQGNAAITSVNTNYPEPPTSGVDVADGIFWGQNGGNWFIARNSITNYGLEGIQFNGGPAAAVANDFKTSLNYLAVCALAGVSGWAGVNGTTNEAADFTKYFVGNLVEGGRMGYNGNWDGPPAPAPPLNYTFSGNTVTLHPSFERWDDYPGGAVVMRTSNHGNISGNTLLAGGHGVRFIDASTNAVMLKNHFTGITHRAVAYDDSGTSVRNIQILRNVLQYGSYHLSVDHRDSGYFYLWQNTYTNNSAICEPFLNPASSPVHFIR